MARQDRPLIWYSRLRSKNHVQGLSHRSAKKKVLVQTVDDWFQKCTSTYYRNDKHYIEFTNRHQLMPLDEHRTQNRNGQASDMHMRAENSNIDVFVERTLISSILKLGVGKCSLRRLCLAKNDMTVTQNKSICM